MRVVRGGRRSLSTVQDHVLMVYFPGRVYCRVLLVILEGSTMLSQTSFVIRIGGLGQCHCVEISKYMNMMYGLLCLSRTRKGILLSLYH